MQILINISIEMSYIAFYQHTLNNYYHIFAHASPNIPFFKSSFPPLPPCNPLSCANISCEVWLPPLEHCTSTMSTRCPLDKETKCLIISLLCGSGTDRYTACSTSQYIARGAWYRPIYCPRGSRRLSSVAPEWLRAVLSSVVLACSEVLLSHCWCGTLL